MTEAATEPAVPEPEGAGKKQAGIDEILASFEGVGADLGQIGKLLSEENRLVDQFFSMLQKLEPVLRSAVTVSPDALPLVLAGVTQAQIMPTGHLQLTFEDGHLQLVDLSEAKNRDLLVAAVNEIMPALNNLTVQPLREEVEAPEPAPVQEIATIPEPQPPASEPLSEPLPAIPVEAPVGLAEAADSAAEPVQEEAAQEELPVSSVDKETQIAEVTAETLGYLEMLGNEVFEYSPVSRYFDDWMVNLRQIILSFESSEVIGPDEAFTKECNQIFGDIEEELAKRIASEAEIEVSARSLVESRYLLNKIDEGYAAQTKELVVKGKSAIDYLTRNVKRLEAELAELEQIKVSYLHPLKKLAKDQKQSELTQKLNAAKKMLAVAVGASSVEQGKAGDLDAEYAAQTKELADKRKSVIDYLTEEVQALEDQLAQIAKIRTSNPVKKVAREQKRFETTEKLVAAKKRLELAEQNSSFEQERLRAEYERKKQAALGQVKSLEQDIAEKVVDNSAEVRKLATEALAKAVQSLTERKTAPTQANTES